MSDYTWGLVLSFMSGAIATAACVPSQKHVRALDTGAQAVSAMSPIVVASYQAMQELCLKEPPPGDEECIRAVRARFGPVESVVERFRKEYCELSEHPEDCQ